MNVTSVTLSLLLLLTACAGADDDTASELFAVERALTGAERRLGRISSGSNRRR